MWDTQILRSFLAFKSEERVKFALIYFVLSRGALFMPKRVPDGGLRPIITIYGGTVKGRAPEDRYFWNLLPYLKVPV
jgi:hypothetical protein